MYHSYVSYVKYYTLYILAAYNIYFSWWHGNPLTDTKFWRNDIDHGKQHHLEEMNFILQTGTFFVNRGKLPTFQSLFGPKIPYFAKQV